MKTIRLLSIFTIFLFFAETAMAANHYIRAGAGGSTCEDWGANACNALPASLVRGDTYYIAGGSYGGRTFNTATSGTSVITIKGATIADHGTGTGWSDSYSVETTQATWTSGLTFNTSYWVFDGSVGPTWSKTPSQYGFLISPVAFALRVYNTSTAITDITLSHIAATATSSTVEKYFLSTDNSTKSVNNVTVSHCYANGWENTIWATSAGLAMNNWIFEYSVSLNGWGTATYHGEDINNNYGNLGITVRYNWFEGRQSDGSTGCIVCLNGACQPYYIYGNVFKNMSGGNGCIAGIHYTLSGTVHNNTFINFDTGYGNGQWIGALVTSTVYNNLVYTGNAAMGSATMHDYNAYFSTTNTPSEAHGQTGSGSPFLNLSGGNLHLSTASTPGITLFSPYNADVDGNIRGADGLWDRGALESGGTPQKRLQAVNLQVN